MAKLSSFLLLSLILNFLANVSLVKADAWLLPKGKSSSSFSFGVIHYLLPHPDKIDPRILAELLNTEIPEGLPIKAWKSRKDSYTRLKYAYGFEDNVELGIDVRLRKNYKANTYCFYHLEAQNHLADINPVKYGRLPKKINLVDLYLKYAVFINENMVVSMKTSFGYNEFAKNNFQLNPALGYRWKTKNNLYNFIEIGPELRVNFLQKEFKSINFAAGIYTKNILNTIKISKAFATHNYFKKERYYAEIGQVFPLNEFIDLQYSFISGLNNKSELSMRGWSLGINIGGRVQKYEK